MIKIYVTRWPGRSIEHSAYGTIAAVRSFALRLDDENPLPQDWRWAHRFWFEAIDATGEGAGDYEVTVQGAPQDEAELRRFLRQAE